MTLTVREHLRLDRLSALEVFRATGWLSATEGFLDQRSAVRSEAEYRLTPPAGSRKGNGAHA